MITFLFENGLLAPSYTMPYLKTKQGLFCFKNQERNKEIGFKLYYLVTIHWIDPYLSAV